MTLKNMVGDTVWQEKEAEKNKKWLIISFFSVGDSVKLRGKIPFVFLCEILRM